MMNTINRGGGVSDLNDMSTPSPVRMSHLNHLGSSQDSLVLGLGSNLGTGVGLSNNHLEGGFSTLGGFLSSSRPSSALGLSLSSPTSPVRQISNPNPNQHSNNNLGMGIAGHPLFQPNNNRGMSNTNGTPSNIAIARAVSAPGPGMGGLDFGGGGNNQGSSSNGK